MSLEKTTIENLKVELPEAWEIIDFTQSIDNVPISEKKVKKGDYLEEGQIPVIDQGKELIGGFTNTIEKIVECDLPVIIFGDHTRAIKYVNSEFAAGADGIKVFQPQKYYNPKLLYYFLMNLKLPDKGYSRHFKYLKKERIPLPPLPEQKRIVAKIEELFTQLDAGAAALKRAQANLKRYKASVLKAACEGRLVPTAAELHPDDYEPASVLLERILKERRAKWEADLIAEGKDPSKRKYKEPAQPDVENLPELPEGWVWVTFEALVNFKNGINFSKEQKGNEGYPTMDVLNMYSEGIALDLSNIYKVNKQIKEDYLLRNGDILFVRSSVKREGVGWASMFTEANEPTTYCGFIIRARLVSKNVTPEYITYFMRSAFARERLIGSSSQVTITNINQKALGSIPIPVPSISEQNRIIRRVERFFSVIREQEKQIKTSLKRSERLSQAILKRAFEGKLVPQDPKDEPASVLLERVRGK